MHFDGRPNGQAPCSRHSKGVAKCLQYCLSFSFQQQTPTKPQARISDMLCNDFCCCLLLHDVARRRKLPRVDGSLRRLHQNTGLRRVFSPFVGKILKFYSKTHQNIAKPPAIHTVDSAESSRHLWAKFSNSKAKHTKT